MGTGRWRLELVEEPEHAPMLLFRSPAPHAEPLPSRSEGAMASLLEAFDLLSRRGVGKLAWSASFRDDPIAFLLDALNDAVTVWDATGRLVYRNRAGARLNLERRDEAALELFTARGTRFERRCLRCRSGETDYVLEIVHVLGAAARNGGPNAS